MADTRPDNLPLIVVLAAPAVREGARWPTALADASCRFVNDPYAAAAVLARQTVSAFVVDPACCGPACIAALVRLRELTALPVWRLDGVAGACLRLTEAGIGPVPQTLPPQQVRSPQLAQAPVNDSRGTPQPGPAKPTSASAAPARLPPPPPAVPVKPAPATVPEVPPRESPVHEPEPIAGLYDSMDNQPLLSEAELRALLDDPESTALRKDGEG